MSTTAADLLRAALDAPADAAVRLALADLCEEAGNPDSRHLRERGRWLVNTSGVHWLSWHGWAATIVRSLGGINTEPCPLCRIFSVAYSHGHWCCSVCGRGRELWLS